MESQKYKAIINYKVFVFDLDDTIYDETEFLFSAYRFISDYIAGKSGEKAVKYETFLIHSFKTFGREKLFDRLIADFQLCDVVTVEELLQLLRSHKVPLTIHEKVLSFLRKLIREDKQIFILTNGHPVQQRNKIQGLGLSRILPGIKIIYANEYEPKPSPYCINRIIEHDKVSRSEILVIGDSETDRLTAENANVDFLNISTINRSLDF